MSMNDVQPAGFFTRNLPMPTRRLAVSRTSWNASKRRSS